MFLKITDSDEDFGLNVYKISLYNFGQKEYHPFIAAQDWDYVEIDLTEDTPRGYIKQLLRETKVIPKFDKNNVSVRVMQLLCEIIPDYAGELRKLFVQDKAGLKDLLESLAVQYEW